MDQSIINFAKALCAMNPHADAISSIRNWHPPKEFILADNDHLFFVLVHEEYFLCEKDSETIKDSIRDYCAHLTIDSSYMVPHFDDDVKWRGVPAKDRYSIYDITQAKLLYGKRFKPQKPTPHAELETFNEHPETQHPTFSSLVGKLKVIPIAETKPRPPSSLLATIEKAAAKSIRKEFKRHEAVDTRTQGETAKLLTLCRATVNRYEKAEKANNGEPTNVWGYRSEYRLNSKLHYKLQEIRLNILAWREARRMGKKLGISSSFSDVAFIENLVMPPPKDLNGLTEEERFKLIAESTLNKWITKRH